MKQRNKNFPHIITSETWTMWTGLPITVSLVNRCSAGCRFPPVREDGRPEGRPIGIKRNNPSLPLLPLKPCTTIKLSDPSTRFNIYFHFWCTPCDKTPRQGYCNRSSFALNSILFTMPTIPTVLCMVVFQLNF